MAKEKCLSTFSKRCNNHTPSRRKWFQLDYANSAYKLFDLVNNKYVKLLGDIDVNGKMIVGKHSSNAGKLYQILGWTQIK